MLKFVPLIISRIYMNKNQLDILYEDNHLIAINKPAGLLSQGDKTGDIDALKKVKTYIKNEYNKPGAVYLGLPHRLDRPVSGVLLLCKTSKALTRMNQLIKERAISKIYHTITQSKPQQQAGTLIHYIKKDTKNNRAIISEKSFKDSKLAQLDFSHIATVDKFHLLEVTLKTGRPHQIRAQLAHYKLAIYGDVKYAKQKPLNDMSIALHAHSLEFIHPVKKEPLRITAKYPRTAWWSRFK